MDTQAVRPYGVVAEELPALFGGPRAKTVAYGTGKRFGDEEKREVCEALDQQTLFYWSGKKVRELCRRFAEMYGVPYAVATSSGTASLHVALGACGVGPGDEVITSPITDMGTLIGILYQGAIPVFADLDPFDYTLDPASVEANVTDKTKAIIPVHLCGNPSHMDEIMAIASRHGLRVVEDCAQAFHAEYRGRLCGTIGDVGAFSLNDFKHISVGDGGIAITRDPELGPKMALFADKAYDRTPGGRGAVVPYLAPNYRMSELQGAVGIAQLGRLEEIIARRRRYGEGLTAGIEGLPGIRPMRVVEGGKSSYWFYMFRIDEAELGATRTRFVEALAAEGITASAGYVDRVKYRCDLFVNKSAFPGTKYPWDSPYYGRGRDYPEGLCPVAEEIVRTCVKLPVSEFFTERDLAETVAGISKVARYFASRRGEGGRG
ncbi:MAG: DegT/DnrJ/EryC1/StrS family aminotransferase [Planctomycetota bacterium]|nr:DegT/DnrJ/EryC1/StrS family aminotransferase [Planctomycetota bacterium]